MQGTYGKVEMTDAEDKVSMRSEDAADRILLGQRRQLEEAKKARVKNGSAPIGEEEAGVGEGFAYARKVPSKEESFWTVYRWSVLAVLFLVAATGGIVWAVNDGNISKEHKGEYQTFKVAGKPTLKWHKEGVSKEAVVPGDDDIVPPRASLDGFYF